MMGNQRGLAALQRRRADPLRCRLRDAQVCAREAVAVCDQSDGVAGHLNLADKDAGRRGGGAATATGGCGSSVIVVAAAAASEKGKCGD